MEERMGPEVPIEDQSDMIAVRQIRACELWRPDEKTTRAATQTTGQAQDVTSYNQANMIPTFGAPLCFSGQVLRRVCLIFSIFSCNLLILPPTYVARSVASVVV